MADQPSGTGVAGRLAAWVKGLVTAVLGLCSGAVLMYASPLIDRVVKPGKPVANFAAQAQGLQVTFQNRSTGGTEGWWDFGDGSALEPFVPDQATLNHAYAKPGVYTAKLSVRNLLGEENDRTANINLDGSSPSLPAIESFTVVPVGSDTYAPAAFHVLCKVKNAELCVWALGHERPLEVCTDGAACQERVVTFRRPGTHVIRFAAFNGKQAVEKSHAVTVTDPPKGSVTVALNVKRQAMQVLTSTTTRTVSVPFPPKSKETVAPLATFIGADQGCQIMDARLVQAANVKDAKVEITPDRQQIKLTGQIVRPTTFLRLPHTQPPPAVLQLAMTQERQMPVVALPVEPVGDSFTVPGSTLLPVPKLDSGWVMKQQTLSIELRDGDRVVWQAAQFPATGTVLVQGRQLRASAALSGEQVRVDLIPVDARLGFAPVGN
jgi:hypothetical protein